MPVMPAPITSTSTGDGGSDAGPEDDVIATRMGLYRPVSIVLERRSPGGDGPHGDRGPEVVGTAGALRDGGPGPGAQGALRRSGLLPDGGRAPLAPRLADGVPAGGDPAAARLRRVRDPRPVGGRGAHRGHGCAGVPERLPPPGRPGRPGSGNVRRRVHLPVPRV